jgi:hypothetical protein
VGRGTFASAVVNTALLTQRGTHYCNSTSQALLSSSSSPEATATIGYMTRLVVVASMSLQTASSTSRHGSDTTAATADASITQLGVTTLAPLLPLIMAAGPVVAAANEGALCHFWQAAQVVSTLLCDDAQRVAMPIVQNFMNIIPSSISNKNNRLVVLAMDACRQILLCPVNVSVPVCSCGNNNKQQRLAMDHAVVQRLLYYFIAVRVRGS